MNIKARKHRLVKVIIISPIGIQVPPQKVLGPSKHPPQSHLLRGYLDPMILREVKRTIGQPTLGANSKGERGLLCSWTNFFGNRPTQSSGVHVPRADGNVSGDDSPSGPTSRGLAKWRPFLYFFVQTTLILETCVHLCSMGPHMNMNRLRTCTLTNASYIN